MKRNKSQKVILYYLEPITFLSFLETKIHSYPYMGMSVFHLMRSCFQLHIWSNPKNGRFIKSSTIITLTHANQMTSTYRHEFIIHSRLRSSCIWSSYKILIFSIHRFIKRSNILWSNFIKAHLYLHSHVSHKRDFDQIISNNYKVSCIHSITE